MLQVQSRSRAWADHVRRMFQWCRASRLGRMAAEGAGPPNKGMKLTKPSILELRSLSPVLDGRRGRT